MTEPLTIGRFRALAHAYGGVVARWPEPYRGDAALLSRHPEAAAILAEATALDGLLDEWRVPAPQRALADRIAATGPAGRSFGRARLWWSAIGIATALAGAAAGTAAAAIAAPAEASAGSTSFGDVAAPES